MVGRTCHRRKDVEVHGEPDEEHFVELGVSAIFIRHRDGAYGRSVRGIARKENLEVPRASTPQRKPLGREEESSLECEEA